MRAAVENVIISFLSFILKPKVMYHVVFFDKEVSRTWVNAFGIRNFSIDDDPEDMGKVC